MIRASIPNEKVLLGILCNHKITFFCCHNIGEQYPHDLMVLQRVDSQPKPIQNNVGLKFFTITINVILVESYAAIK